MTKSCCKGAGWVGGQQGQRAGSQGHCGSQGLGHQQVQTGSRHAWGLEWYQISKQSEGSQAGSLAYKEILNQGSE